jgi:hypothetical protein
MWESGLIQSSSTTALQDCSSTGSYCHYLVISVPDLHHFDHFEADPGPAFLFDADPYPTFHSDVDPDPDLTFQFDAVLDSDPVTHFLPDLDPPVL